MSDEIDPPPDDAMVFAAQDLGRSRPADASRVVAEFGFAATPRATPNPVPDPAHEGAFVRGGREAASPPPGPKAEGAPPVMRTSFRLDTTSAAPAGPQGGEPPWLLREPPAQTAAAASRQGWATRPSEQSDRSTDDIMLRLREEAVDVSWKAAWIAVRSADTRLQRKHDA